MLLHVVESVLIGIHQLEGLFVEQELSSHIQVLNCEPLRLLTLKQLLAWLLYPAPLQELTTDHTCNKHTHTHTRAHTHPHTQTHTQTHTHTHTHTHTQTHTNTHTLTHTHTHTNTNTNT